MGFNDGDVTWELVWKESRLRCVEGAETISYNMPGKTASREWEEDVGVSRGVFEYGTNALVLLTGFREAYDRFPKKIYFFATHKEQRDYNAKHSKQESDDPIGDSDVGSSVDETSTRSPERVQQSPPFKLHQSLSSSTIVASQSGVMGLETIAQGQEELRQQHEARHTELKRELQQSQDHVISRLKDQLQEQFQVQLREQKREYEKMALQSQAQSQTELRALQDQLAEMKEILAAALNSRS